MTSIRTWDQAETRLAEVWGSFNPRPQQRTLAHAVTQTVTGNSKYPVRLAQAGCGVGKSLAYLIPAIASGQRVVVAVSTRALQDQLVGKDLPMLQQALFPDLTFASLKGRSNYVCLRAADKAGQTQLTRVAPGSNGERADLVNPVTDEQWREITVDTEGCVGRKKCPFGDECYSEQARSRALSARVLVVNTSLLTMDLRFRAMTRGKVSLLGEYGVLIVDEAHEMADIVTSGLSTTVTLHRILDTTSRLAFHLDSPDAPSQIDRVNTLASSYFNAAKTWFEQQKGEARTAELEVEDHDSLAKLLEAFRPVQGKVMQAECNCEPTFDPETGEEDLHCEFSRRVNSLVTDLEIFADPGARQDVVWMETSRTGNVMLKASPAEVGGFLNATLWAPSFEDPKASVLTSATMGVGGDFTYIARRLGVSAYEDLDVGTPFEFKRQARLYLPPTSAPSPSKQKPEWKLWAREQMFNLVAASGGGALLLFTSTTEMREAREAVGSRIHSKLGHRVLMQGDGMDNRQLAELFAADEDSVLFATRSFMTGVDFAGRACRLVTVNKMPFSVPEEPVFKARCQAADARFGEGASFRRVSLPEMSLVLTQAFGRLIRTMDDQGVVAILDSRMRAGWAGSVRRSLPPAPLVSSVQEVQQFYRELTLPVG